MKKIWIGIVLVVVVVGIIAISESQKPQQGTNLEAISEYNDQLLDRANENKQEAADAIELLNEASAYGN